MGSLGWLAVAASLVVVPGFGQAQEAQRAPDGGMSVRIPGVDVLPIPGRPFSAGSTIDWIRALPDGSTVHKHLASNMARDSSGRVYRESHHFAPEDGRPSPPYETVVYDPTNLTATTCVVATKHCLVTNFRPRTQFVLAPAGPFRNGVGTLTRDALGADTMQGLPVTGTRETTTINPGAEGNSSALVSTKEFWYSADLETNLAVTRNNPSDGQQVIRLNSISRSEPEASVFAVPSGFTVEDARVAKVQR